MDAQQNSGVETPTSIPAAGPMTAYSDTVSEMDGCTVSTDKSQVKMSTIQLPATCKQSDLSDVSLASSTSAFKSLKQSAHYQAELNEDNLKHSAALNQLSAGSSTDLSHSASSSTNLSEDNGGNHINNGSHYETGRPSLFHAVVRMMALVEGGILEPTDPEYGFAMNDALYGILINKTHRLVYTREFGLRLVQLID